MLTSMIRIGHIPADTAAERRTKSIFAVSMVGATIFSIQLTFFGERTPFELFFDGAAIVGTLGALIVLQLTKRVDFAFSFIAAIGLSVLSVSSMVNGNRDGDLFFLTMIPVFAVLLLGARRSLYWFTATLLVVLAAAVVDAIPPDLASSLHRSDINPEGFLFLGPTKERLTTEKLVALFTSLTLTYVLVFSVHSALQQANERIEGLLLNILPPSIAARLTEANRQKLQQDGAGIADEYSEATILFADIVGFTDLAAKSSTAEVMAVLDEVFTEFDRLAEKHRVEKIKTIGDAYMAVCGLPEPDPDHAKNIADMALDMLDVAGQFRERSGTGIRLRIGVNSGPVVAGIIGRKKFIYDLWGDSVNVASRMESHGVPDTVQVSSGTYEALKESYEFEALGKIEIKGKGRLPAWRLIGPKVR